MFGLFKFTLIPWLGLHFWILIVDHQITYMYIKTSLSIILFLLFIQIIFHSYSMKYNLEISDMLLHIYFIIWSCLQSAHTHKNIQSELDPSTRYSAADCLANLKLTRNKWPINGRFLQQQTQTSTILPISDCGQRDGRKNTHASYVMYLFS